MEYKHAGFGLGLRGPHYDQVLEERPKLDWFEIISENYIDAHKGYWQMLADLRHDYQFVMHGVALSIGSTDPLDQEYLAKLKKLANFLEISWLSDHLCFTGVQHKNSHDLLPIPYTEEALAHVVPRIHAVQEALNRPIVLENASSYLEFNGATIPEQEFLGELVKQTGCGILLDVNNVYVSSFNHGWEARDYIDAIPADAIMQYHLAGHMHKQNHIIDTHDREVADPVWDLFAYTVRTKGFKNTMIEWDDNIPEFEVLFAELQKAKALVDRVAQEKNNAA